MLRSVFRRLLFRPRHLAFQQTFFAGEQLEDRRMLAAVQMSDREQLLLELVNRARNDPAGEAAIFEMGLNDDLTPEEEISITPKQPLSPNQALVLAARRHSDDMLGFEFFAHENLRGLGPSDRAKAAGYPSGAGENIAWFGLAGELDRDQQVYERHQALFESPPHRTNMMNPGYRELGNGVRFGLFESRNSIMVTENFGNPGGNNFITGVAFTDRVVPNRFYEIGESVDSMTIEAVRQLDGQKFTTTTGQSGGYGLQVPAGVYTVTGRKGGTNIEVNHVFVNGINVKVDFNTRDESLGVIAGRVFDDVDRDGVHDPNEGYLSNVKIYIDALENGQLDTHEYFTETNSDGAYSISGLQKGDYRVRVVSAKNQNVSTPQDDFYDIELKVSETYNSATFGIAPPSQPPTVQNDLSETVAGVSVIIDVLANDSDVEGPLNTASVRVAFQPPNGRAHVDEFSGTITYVPNAGFTGPDAFLYTVEDQEGFQSSNGRVDVLVRQGVGAIWQNQRDRFDVNDDQFLTALDVLMILNDINANGARRLTIQDTAPPPFIDVTGDGFVSAIDPLQVTNEINARLRALSAEGENEFDVLETENVVGPRFATPAQSNSRLLEDSSDNELSHFNRASTLARRADLALLAIYQTSELETDDWRKKFVAANH